MEKWTELIDLDAVTSFKAMDDRLIIKTYNNSQDAVFSTVGEPEYYDSFFEEQKGKIRIELESDILRFQKLEHNIKNFDSYLIRKILLKILAALLPWLHKVSLETKEEILLKTYIDKTHNRFIADIALSNDLPVTLLKITEIKRNRGTCGTQK